MANFHHKMKMMNLQYFCIFMYIWWLLKFLWVFFLCVESLPNPVAMPELSNSSASKAWQVLTKKNKIVTNQPPVATTVPSGAILRALIYRGIPSDLRSRPEQSHHLPGALLPRWLQAVYRVSNGRLHLKLYRKGPYSYYLWLYSENTAKKDVLFDES